MNQKLTPSETAVPFDPFDREAFWQAFEHQREFTLQLVAQLSEAVLCAQPHPLYSPVGWHLGHIGYTEAFWLLPDCSAISDRDRYWYAADGRPKVERQYLPPYNELLNYLAKIRRRTGDRLCTLTAEQWQRELRLWWWILQHEAQHTETMQMVLAMQGILTTLPPNPSCPQKYQQIPAGSYVIGSEDPLALDNEQPVQSIELLPFTIDAAPVTWREFLAFVEAGGYQRREWWSSRGWEWRKAEEITSPFYPIPENLDLPMWGLSFYEAEAYGHFRGKRLPSEREWEIAAQQGLLNKGYVWEWTQSPFAPYPGFQSYPYRGYSGPYFDGEHFVLKGGSHWTRPLLKRPSFRNWYSRTTREVFAGARYVDQEDLIAQ